MKNTPPLGPAPTPAPDEALAPDVPRARVLRALGDLQGRATVADIAATLGGHPNTTRHHLRILLDEGLVQVEPAEPSATRGRPTLRYAVSASGRRALAPRHGEPEAAQYLALAGAFADRLAAIGGDPREDSRAIGRSWASVLTGPSAAWPPGPGSG
ncbi:MAG: helix-turn-helix domain-containing protein, partial [Ornithinibacter sp.]